MGYTTLRMRPEHRTDVLRLLGENLSDLRRADVLEDRYRWSYLKNPEGSAHTVVAVNDAAGDIVGCGSAYPRKLFVAGTPVKVGIPADFVVARAHRIGAAAIGIQRALVGEANEAGFSFFMGFPYKTSLPVLQRVGYRPFAAARAWIKPLSAEYKLRPHLPRPVAWLAARPADWYLASADAWRRRNRRRVAGEITSRADARFDDLWERARHQYVVAGERSAAYLNWRYSDFTTARFAFFCLTDKRTGDLLGYVAYSSKADKVFVADVFALDMRETAGLLLLEFARRMRRERMQSIYISYAGNTGFDEMLATLGFYSKGEQPRKVVALGTPASAHLERLLLDSQNYYLFDGEMDI